MKICFVPFTSALTFISECISSIYIVFLIVIGVAESSHSECEKKNRNTEDRLLLQLEMNFKCID